MSNEIAPRRAYSAVEMYDTAVLALEKAKTLVETMQVHDVAEALKLQGRLSKDGEAIARAVELRMRSERKLGGMLAELKERGELRAGKAGKARISLAEVGIDHKLSSAAQKLAAFNEGQFEAVLGQSLDKIRAGRAVVVNPVKDLSTEDKKIRRRVREAQLALRQQDLPAGKYGAILADPEWAAETWSENGKDRAPDNHYPTSSIEAIAARPVGDIAAADCVIALWIPMRHLALGHHVTVLRAWGFEPRTVLVWDKVVAGTGYWFRNRTEAVVIATRGNVPAPAPGTQWEDLMVFSKSITHSRKPDFMHEWFEEFFPTLTKIELNARRARQGWAAWGNEAPDEEIIEIRQDVPADPDLSASPPADMARLPSAAAEPETAGGVDPTGRGAGEGERADAPAEALPRPDPVLPHADVSVEQLSNAQRNDIIRACYAMEPFPGLNFVAVRAGLPDGAVVKRRAWRMGLGSRARQLAAVSKTAAERVSA